MPPPTGQPADAHFVTTRWTVVLEAAQADDSAAQNAMAELCRIYWYPLYAFVRRRGYAPHDAEDLTQGFFLALLEKDFLDGITREGGRFRSFLLTALKRFLANEWDRASARKRGGGCILLSLEGAEAEERYLLEPVDRSTPESLFHRRWALTLLEKVLDQLKHEFGRTNNLEVFETLKPAIVGDRTRSYLEIASELKTSEGAVKVAVHRLRNRFRILMRETIAQTVDTPEEVESELHFLMQSVAS
jgi:RNA polymerase sigma factor (sigma-70 family)